MNFVILILKILGILIIIPVIIFAFVFSLIITIQIIKGGLGSIIEDIRGDKK